MVSLVDPRTDGSVVNELSKLLKLCNKTVPDWFLNLHELRSAHEQGEHSAGKQLPKELRNTEEADPKLVILYFSRIGRG